MEYSADVRGICSHLSKVEAELRLLDQLQGQVRLAAARSQESQMQVQLKQILRRTVDLEEAGRRLRLVLRNFTEEMELHSSQTAELLQTAWRAPGSF